MRIELLSSPVESDDKTALRLALLAALPMFLLASCSEVPAPQIIAAADQLRLEASTDDAVWNAVTVKDGAIYASGPRWAGGSESPLTRIKEGRAEPFPDAEWNAWRAGTPASERFINLNALRLDATGMLWAVDTGSPEFGGDPLPGGAKLVAIDLATGRVDRVVYFASDIARPGSYVDDVRFNGRHAYLTDAGNPGLIVLDLETGRARRVLDHHPSTVARDDRPIVVDGAILRGPDGEPLRVHSDPLELTPDGSWLLFGPLAGPWSRIPTSVLDDASLSPAVVAAAVEPFADLPPTGGTAMDRAGNLYFSDLSANAIKRRATNGEISTLASDRRLHWIDAMFLDETERLWMPAAQIDRVALFHHGVSRVRQPVALFSLDLGAGQ